MAYVELHEEKMSDAWFFDSGCSNQLCGNQDFVFEPGHNFLSHCQAWKQYKNEGH